MHHLKTMLSEFLQEGLRFYGECYPSKKDLFFLSPAE